MSRGPKGERGLRLPFYALCNRTHIDDTDVIDRPIRPFHGAADDWTLVSSCRAYVERLRRAGKDVTLTEYVGAYHNFDHPLLTPVRRTSPRVRNIGSCPISEDPVGRFVNRESGRPLTLEDPCVQSGVTVGYDARDQLLARTGTAVANYRACLAIIESSESSTWQISS